MENYNIINKNVCIDIVKFVDAGGGSEVKAMDILPVAAAPIFLLDEKTDVSSRAKIYGAAMRFRATKALPHNSYDKAGLIDALSFRWVSTLELATMEELLSGLSVIAGFDEEHNVVLDEKFAGIYHKFAEDPNFVPLKYNGTKGFNKSDEECLVYIHKRLEYPPFNGRKIWSWKCSTEDYKEGLPAELCCVGENEWFDRSLEDVKSIEEFATIRGGKATKGTVTRAWWDFAHTVKDGDIVVYRDYQKNIIAGIGKFVGVYHYKPEMPNYRSRRDVVWLSSEHYASPTNIGNGNTSPMEIDDPAKLKDLLPIISNAILSHQR